MLSEELRKPQRQAWLGVAVLYVKNLRIGFNIFLAMIVPMFAGWGVGGSYMYFALAVALVALGIIAYLQYRNFFFQVVDDKFIINQGVLEKRRIECAFFTHSKRTHQAKYHSADFARGCAGNRYGR
jgi:uncharacterized membrane protein YdbT with pleckstrin-like domain